MKTPIIVWVVLSDRYDNIQAPGHVFLFIGILENERKDRLKL